MVGLVVGLYVGCGPRALVAKDKVIKEIDKVLGELNVKRKKVAMAYDKVENAYQGMREKRIEAKILKDRFDEEISELESDQSSHKTNLGKLKTLLEEGQSTGSVEKNGKTVTLAELKAIADKTVKELKRTQEKLAHKKKMAAVSEKNLAILVANAETSKKQLAQFKEDIETIDSKKEMLDSMKTDASLLQGQGASINDEFDKLSKDVKELMTKVDTQVAIEEAKLEERIADMNSEPASVDDLFSDGDDVSGTLSDIDALLKDN
jgi:chromosome segregation ATPase